MRLMHREEQLVPIYYTIIYLILVFVCNMEMVDDSSWEKINGIKRELEKIASVDLKTT